MDRAMSGRKVILVLIDGLSYEAALSRMGYIQHLAGKGLLHGFMMNAELPTMSRPLYEVIHTGTPPYINGITNNFIARRSTMDSIFSLARRNGLKTSAAAYFWFSELYVKAPFDRLNDRDLHDEAADIQVGRFYFEDSYPDTHLFTDADYIRRVYRPDYLLVHPMGADYIGHCFGGESKEYHSKITEMDILLSTFLPMWLADGYTAVVTSDHGMNRNGQHGGTERVEREVPMWITKSENESACPVNGPISQLCVAPTVCGLLGIDKSDRMTAPAITGIYT